VSPPLSPSTELTLSASTRSAAPTRSLRQSPVAICQLFALLLRSVVVVIRAATIALFTHSRIGTTAFRSTDCTEWNRGVRIVPSSKGAFASMVFSSYPHTHTHLFRVKHLDKIRLDEVFERTFFSSHMCARGRGVGTMSV
jgi:hypothetical protein